MKKQKDPKMEMKKESGGKLGKKSKAPFGPSKGMKK